MHWRPLSHRVVAKKYPGRVPGSRGRSSCLLIERDKDPIIWVEIRLLEPGFLLQLRSGEFQVQMDCGAKNLTKKILVAVLGEDQLIYTRVIVLGGSASEHSNVLPPVVDYNCDLIWGVDRVITIREKHAAVNNKG